MIIADTNVWSEAARLAPHARVVAWMAAHRDELALTTVTVGELLFGLALMPEGRRRTALTTEIEQLIAGAASRIFPYDTDAARECADVRARRKRAGREVVKPEDAMIAAIARARGCAVATHNVGDFEGMGVQVIDPWTA